MANSMKKLLSLFVAVVMIMSMIPAVSATDETTKSASNIPENVDWIELSSKDDFLNWFSGAGKSKNLTQNYTSGMTRYYKLMADITIDQDSTVYYLSAGNYLVNTYINLNGKTLLIPVLLNLRVVSSVPIMQKVPKLL